MALLVTHLSKLQTLELPGTLSYPCALFVTSQCLLDPPLLLAPTVKTMLASFAGGLYLLQCVSPHCCLHPCWNTSVTWWFVSQSCSSSPSLSATLFPLCQAPAPSVFLCPLLTVARHSLLFLFYPETLWLILPDLDLMSALQWTLSGPQAGLAASPSLCPLQITHIY